ncbi:MAG: hypothetical protein R2682_08645 [Pyrinomonadaceae bacterium]
MSARVEEKHRAPIRWMHWINFPLLAMMTWSGLLIYWADPSIRCGFSAMRSSTFFRKGFTAF